jgi:putative transposase
MPERRSRACDFFVAVTAALRVFHVFAVIEHATRRLVHFNVTANPSAGWTLQQLREAVADSDERRYLIHDRDRIVTKRLDESIAALGIEVVRSPADSPQANASCERVIGTIRRECLDWMIPMSQSHPRSILRECVAHYNGARPHSSLGPGVPGLPRDSPPAASSESRHRLAAGSRVLARSVLGGLHHEYSIEASPAAA